MGGRQKQRHCLRSTARLCQELGTKASSPASSTDSIETTNHTDGVDDYLPSMMTVPVMLLAGAVVVLLAASEVDTHSANVDTKAEEEPGRVLLDRVVRHLDISPSSSGCFTIGDDKEVCSMKLHSRSSSIDLDKNYLGFTLYDSTSNRNGVGTMHFVEDSVAEQHAYSCPSRTRHSGAYHYIYGKCPDAEQNLVASGYCYFGNPPDGRAEGLDFNSGTFNMRRHPWADRRYYSDDDRRVNPSEIDDIRECFAQLRLNDFAVTTDWRCSFPIVKHRGDGELRRLAPIRPHYQHSTCSDYSQVLPASGSPPSSDLSLAVLVAVIVNKMLWF